MIIFPFKNTQLVVSEKIKCKISINANKYFYNGLSFLILNNKQKNYNSFHYFCFILSAERFKLR